MSYYYYYSFYTEQNGIEDDTNKSNTRNVTSTGELHEKG